MSLKPMRRPKDHRHGRHIVFASRRMDHRARNLRRRGKELSEDGALTLVVSDALDVAHQHRVRAIDPVERTLRRGPQIVPSEQLGASGKYPT